MSKLQLMRFHLVKSVHVLVKLVITRSDLYHLTTAMACGNAFKMAVALAVKCS